MEKLVSVSKNKQNNPEQTKEQKQIGKERKGLIPSFAKSSTVSTELYFEFSVIPKFF